MRLVGVEKATARYTELAAAFKARFGAAPELFARAPGALPLVLMFIRFILQRHMYVAVP